MQIILSVYSKKWGHFSLYDVYFNRYADFFRILMSSVYVPSPLLIRQQIAFFAANSARD